MHKDLNEAMITCNHDRECSSHHAGKHRSKDTEYELIFICSVDLLVRQYG